MTLHKVKLLSCPFCGGTAALQEYDYPAICRKRIPNRKIVRVACCSCGASTERIPTNAEPGKDIAESGGSKLAIWAWNNRTEKAAGGDRSADSSEQSIGDLMTSRTHGAASDVAAKMQQAFDVVIQIPQSFDVLMKLPQVMQTLADTMADKGLSTETRRQAEQTLNMAQNLVYTIGDYADLMRNTAEQYGQSET